VREHEQERGPGGLVKLSQRRAVFGADLHVRSVLAAPGLAAVPEGARMLGLATAQAASELAAGPRPSAGPEVRWLHFPGSAMRE
jgi:hypothetical protein